MSNMLQELFVLEVQLFWQLRKVRNDNTPLRKNTLTKINKAIATLEIKSEEFQQPLRLFILLYANYYVNIARARSFNFVLLKIQEFYNRFHLDEIEKYTEDEITTAIALRKAWNNMHQCTAATFPFKTRAILLKSGVAVKRDTFFAHEQNILYFAKIAKFVEANRLGYPELHGHTEFFIHLPVVKCKKKQYKVTEYLHPRDTLELYYGRVYGRDVKKSERFARVVDVAKRHPGAYVNNSLWCASALAKEMQGG